MYPLSRFPPRGTAGIGIASVAGNSGSIDDRAIGSFCAGATVDKDAGYTGGRCDTPGSVDLPVLLESPGTGICIVARNNGSVDDFGRGSTLTDDDKDGFESYDGRRGLASEYLNRACPTLTVMRHCASDPIAA